MPYKDLMKEADTIICNDFNSAYFDIHSFITNGEYSDSRNGNTFERLDFRTVTYQPLKRCVAGYKRDINIFFLLAEAMWIFVGRRDVKFMDMFNGRLKDYSDDGKFYNAPYGWRLRKYGVDSMIDYDETNYHAIDQGIDQIKEAVEKMAYNPDDRRIVLDIWNPEFDLMRESKDKACNDNLMYKIRNKRLYATINNRSNDLDWGLTTNIFQFSFIGEIISSILNVDYARQLHNSQSLHLYLNNPLTADLESVKQLEPNYTQHLIFYSMFKTLSIEFDFDQQSIWREETHTPEERKNIAGGRLLRTDMLIMRIINSLIMLRATNDKITYKDCRDNILATFLNEDKALAMHFLILSIYQEYKLIHKNHQEAIIDIIKYAGFYDIYDVDFVVLALNFFFKRIRKKDVNEYNRLSDMLKSEFNVYRNFDIGKL